MCDRRHQPTFVIAVLTFVAATVSIMQTLALPLVPLLPQYLDTTLAQASWVATASTLAGAVSNPLLGRAGDLYGAKRVLVLALALLFVGSLLGAIAPNLVVLVAGRSLQGVAVGAIALGIGIMREVLPMRYLARGTTSMGAMMGIGGGLGVPLAGVLARSNWHTVFWVATGLSLLALAAVLVVVPGSLVAKQGRFDPIGALGLTILTLLVLIPITYSTTWGLTDPRLLVCLLLAFVVGVPWTRHQLRARSPITDLRLMMRRPVLRLHLVGFLIGTAMFGNFASAIQAAVFPRTSGYALGLDLVQAGLLMLPGALLSLALVPVTTSITQRWGSRTTLLLGLLLATAGAALRVSLKPSELHLALGYTGVQIGTSIAFATLAMLLADHVPPIATSATNGFNNMCRQIGSSTANATNTAIITSALMIGTTAALHSAFVTLYSIMGAAAIVAALLGLFNPRTTGRCHIEG